MCVNVSLTPLRVCSVDASCLEELKNVDPLGWRSPCAYCGIACSSSSRKSRSRLLDWLWCAPKACPSGQPIRNNACFSLFTAPIVPNRFEWFRWFYAHSKDHVESYSPVFGQTWSYKAALTQYIDVVRVSRCESRNQNLPCLQSR